MADAAQDGEFGRLIDMAFDCAKAGRIACPTICRVVVMPIVVVVVRLPTIIAAIRRNLRRMGRALIAVALSRVEGVERKAQLREEVNAEYPTPCPAAHVEVTTQPGLGVNNKDSSPLAFHPGTAEDVQSSNNASLGSGLRESAVDGPLEF